jgi:hypothetical protein
VFDERVSVTHGLKPSSRSSDCSWWLLKILPEEDVGSHFFPYREVDGRPWICWCDRR